MRLGPRSDLRGAVNCLADAQIRTAAAKVSDFPLDVSVGWVGLVRKQGGRSHDLSGLAIAALRHIRFAPGNLGWMLCIRRKALDGGDFLTHSPTCGQDAGPDRFPVHMHCARPAESHTATEFRPCQTDRVTDDPQERSLGFHIDAIGFSIDFQG
jgi:hypothetical protein